MSTSQPLLSPTTPGQVWRQLATERRQRAIRCLAQLALHAVTARTDPAAQEGIVPPSSAKGREPSNPDVARKLCRSNCRCGLGDHGGGFFTSRSGLLSVDVTDGNHGGENDRQSGNPFGVVFHGSRSPFFFL